MKNLIILIAVLVPIKLKAAIITFQKGEVINASSLNDNFNEIKTLMQSRGIPLTFESFQSGDVIKLDDIESQFDKVRDFDVSVSPINGNFIESQKLNQSFQDIQVGYSQASVWPFGLDGDLTLTSGNYILQPNGNKIDIINSSNSAVIKSNIGSNITSGENEGTCKVDFSSVEIPTGTKLTISPLCKWIVFGVKNNAIINGEIKANQLESSAVLTTKKPNHFGDLVGDTLSHTITQKSGAKGINGTASSRNATFGSGGLAACGFGGGGGAGSGVEGYSKINFGYTGTNQSYIVPANVYQVNFKLWGAGGAGDNYDTHNNGSGGSGTASVGKINVTPGETLNIIVGKGGTVYNVAGFGGGAIGGVSSLIGNRANGGGMSGVFKGLNSFTQLTALAIAGGGGGGSSRDGFSGGRGDSDALGQYNNGHKGTLVEGGCNQKVEGTATSDRGHCGTALNGGAGKSGHNGGGGGGGGYFGGGAGNGGSAVAGGGGGGGSSYINALYATGSLYHSANSIDTANKSDWQYPGGERGRGGVTGTNSALGYDGFAIISIAGSTGGNGETPTCGTYAKGGLSSLNGGGAGGRGGIAGKSGQGVYIKVLGNIIGNGLINAKGENGENGSVGAVGGTAAGLTFGNGGHGGGGAGGNGGRVVIETLGTLSSNLTIDITKGNRGLGGIGAEDGDAGSR